MKKGMSGMGTAGCGIVPLRATIAALLANPWLWGALVAYGLSFVLWLWVLTKVPVSVAFPFLSVGYVVVAVCGHVLFGEPLSAVKVCGLCIICAGVVVLSRG